MEDRGGEDRLPAGTVPLVFGLFCSKKNDVVLVLRWFLRF